MSTASFLTLTEVESRTLDVVARQLGFQRNRLKLSDRLIQDLGCDSLEAVELIMELEDSFQVTLPEDPACPVYKAIFTRVPFRISDLAELVYVRQGTGPAPRRTWRDPAPQPARAERTSFSQLSGICHPDVSAQPLVRLDTPGPLRQFRRPADGMRCIEFPSAEVEIGSNQSALCDEQPRHMVGLDAFVIDAEPVSTSAYCRFLNSIGSVKEAVLKDWFLLDDEDDRNQHVLVQRTSAGWEPAAGAERKPMILVSWYGASAYSLWANGQSWQLYRDDDSRHTPRYLPSEAQWEYAARGAGAQAYPWGDTPPTPEQARFSQHRLGRQYPREDLPLADVNEQLGMSPFGLHHVVGNVWQWCQDWYDERFYRSAEATRRNPVNRQPSHARSERGGSWVGPAELCRNSYRRGRHPLARGRCLGFRCIGKTQSVL